MTLREEFGRVYEASGIFRLFFVLALIVMYCCVLYVIVQQVKPEWLAGSCAVTLLLLISYAAASLTITPYIKTCLDHQFNPNDPAHCDHCFRIGLEKFEMEDIRQLKVKTGDVLVMRCGYKFRDKDQMNNFRDVLKRALGDIDFKILILDQGMTLDVLSQDKE